jgi:hypothetical protein
MIPSLDAILACFWLRAIVPRFDSALSKSSHAAHTVYWTLAC